MDKRTFTIQSIDVDRHYNLQIQAIFALFQEAALNACLSIGADAPALAKKNLDWVIIRMNVEIISIPYLHDEVTVVTYPGDDMAILYPRYYEIWDKDGNVVVKGNSIWGLMDSNTRKLAMRRDAVAHQPPEHREGELPLPEKINHDDSVVLKEKRKIHFTDIDFNGHLNNCSYIRLLVDLHDSEFYKHYSVQSIKVNYLKELKENDEIGLYSTMKDDVEHITVKHDDSDAFYAEIKYKKMD